MKIEPTPDMYNPLKLAVQGGIGKFLDCGKKNNFAGISFK
jgi:hypothetical protein